MKEDMIYSGNGNNGDKHPSQVTVVHLPGGKQAFLPGREERNFKRRGSGLKPKSNKPQEVGMRELPDGTRLRLICDPQNANRTIFAIRRNGVVQLAERFEYGPEVFVPPRRDDLHILHMVIPRGIQPHDAPASMARSAGDLLSEVVKLSPEERVIIGTYVVLTWASDGFPFAPTLGLCGPRQITIPLLQVLASLCRYGLVVGDVKPAGLREVCEQMRPTLLIADYGLGQETMRLLEMGSRPGVFSLQKGGPFSPSCPRAIAFSDASVERDLLSGGVMIGLSPLTLTDLGALSDPEFVERADRLRAQLLDYELQWNGKIRPLAGDLACDLTPQEWEAFRCWAAPFAGDKEYVGELLEAIRSGGELSPDILDVDQRATIVALYILAHNEEQYASVGEVTSYVNAVFKKMGERIGREARRIGSIITQLGFPRRKRGGRCGPYQLEFIAKTTERIHHLVKFHGVWEAEDYVPNLVRVRCRFCREVGLYEKTALRYYEDVVKPAEELRKRKEREDLEREWEELRKNPPPRCFNIPPAGGSQR